MNRKLRIGVIASEVVPYAKTGGLADVIGSLTTACEEIGAEVFLVLPRYWHLADQKMERAGKCIEVPQPEGYEIDVHAFHHELNGIETYLLDIPGFSDRHGLYGENGLDYSDNCHRFSTFSLAALYFIKSMNLKVDVLSVHDWQTSLVPFYLKSTFKDDPFFKNTRSVLTIHNLGYQGTWPAPYFHETMLADRYFHPRYLEFYNRVNFLKGGIVAADRITTVSPTYARECLTEEFGFGLQGVLQDRGDHFKGILNGIDTKIWNPKTDAFISDNYNFRDLGGKKACKIALQTELRLPTLKDIPIVAFMSRLVDQKGADLVADSLKQILSLRLQFVIHGEGDPKIEAQLQKIAREHPTKVAAQVGYYDEELAHRIHAGSDFFLMPSRYEPCGLTQMYSQRYGTIPVVNNVGGLADTVIDAATDPNKGTGIVIDGSTPSNVRHAVFLAAGMYGHWETMPDMQKRGMRKDFSWKTSAEEYCSLFDEALGKPKTKIPQGLH